MKKRISEEKLRDTIQSCVTMIVDARLSRNKFIPGKSPVHYAGRVYDAEEVINAVNASIDFWLTLGPYGNSFESALCAKLKVRHACLVNSGSSANLLAVSALTSPKLRRPLRPGDEVITTAAAFPTTINPIIQNNLRPVFVDVLPRNYNGDPGMIKDALSPRTRAVFFTHTLGNPFDVGAVSALCERHGLYLLEDNCDALGARYDDRFTGTFGDLSTLSFYPAHHITMGEGGAVLTRDGMLQRIVLSFRDWGRDCWCASGTDNTCRNRFNRKLGRLPRGYDHKYIYTHLGYNLKPTDIQAAIGLAQLKKLDDFITARRKNREFFYRAFADLREYFEFQEPTPNSIPSWFGFFMIVKENAPFSRDDLVKALEIKKIQTRMLFGGNITRQPAYRGIACRIMGKLRETDRILTRGLWTGVYPGLSREQLEYMAETFKDEVKKLIHRKVSRRAHE